MSSAFDSENSSISIRGPVAPADSAPTADDEASIWQRFDDSYNALREHFAPQMEIIASHRADEHFITADIAHVMTEAAVDSHMENARDGRTPESLSPKTIAIRVRLYATKLARARCGEASIPQAVQASIRRFCNPDLFSRLQFGDGFSTAVAALKHLARDGDRLLCLKEGLVRSCTKRWFGRGRRSDVHREDDLLQEGRLALLKAIRRYRRHLGMRFTTYAYKVMDNWLASYCRREKGLTEYAARQLTIFRAMKATIAGESGRAPTFDAVCHELGWTGQRRQHAWDRLHVSKVSSLESPLCGRTSSELPGYGPSPLDNAEHIDDVKTIKGAIDQLPPEERVIVTQRYLCGTQWPEICKLLGKDKKQVKSLHRKAKADLTASLGIAYRGLFEK